MTCVARHDFCMVGLSVAYGRVSCSPWHGVVSMPNGDQRNGASDEQRRVADEIAERLRQRGVHLDNSESGEELANLLEGVERFEAAVERRGGDLMMDEPVKEGAAVQPDNAAFVLPTRTRGESVAAFLDRMADAQAAAGRTKK